jgi:L-alanine-DL-glutamate epimerase-like enolase superfamily enzyme
VKLSFRQLDLKLTHSWAIARSSATSVFKVVIVELSDGNSLGLGEAAPISRYHESVDTVMAFCRSVDATKLSFHDVPGSMKYLDTLAPENMAAKCAMNIALLDGAARLAKQPLYEFLGLGFRDQHHVTSFTIGIDTPEMIRKKVAEAERFPVLKIKVGAPGDRENLQAVRAISPAKWIRVDANEGWKTKEQALEMIEWLAQDKFIQYVEQPLPAVTPEKDWTWLKQRSPLPIFADESYHTAADASRCAECFHGVNVKLVKTGGVSGGFEALSAARKLGLKTMIGCMIETSILISAAAHLAELCDFLDVDGNLLITNDPYVGVTAENGILSFTNAPETIGLRVSPKIEKVYLPPCA